MCKFFEIFLIFLGVCSATELSKNESDSLRLVHVFFRHGARTPELKDRYPTDPYGPETFQPAGYGQLTNANIRVVGTHVSSDSSLYFGTHEDVVPNSKEHGKEMAFTLGSVLRKRYSHFLDQIYHPDMVYAKSTDFDRTKMSLLLALAGLFPPSKAQKWHKELDWMPIPYDFDKEQLDHHLRRPNTYCPVYMQELEKQLNSDETLSYLKFQKSLLKFLEENMGKTMGILQDGFGIYQTLTAEKTMNLTLPEWTKDVFPEKITKLALKQVQLENANPLLIRLNGGRSLQFVIKHMIEKIEGTHHPQSRKIYLYSGHENNVINVLYAMNVFRLHFPSYSAAVLIELHYLHKEQVYAVKVLYLKDVNEDPEELEIPGCADMCPLTKFIELTKDQVPKNYTAECESHENLDLYL